MSKKFSKIYVEITNICNLNCSFCSKSFLPKKEMSPSEFKIVLDKIKNYTESIYLHVKGEPLLHSKFDEILSICDEEKIKVSITTNGTLLEKRKDILLKHHIKQINVSLHSENKMPNYFESVFNTCDELSKKMTVIYRIWTLSNLALDKKSTIIVDKIKKHYKLDNIIVNKLLSEKNIKIKDNIYLDKDYEFVWPSEGKSREIVGTCLGTRSHIAILVSGQVVPCCLDSEGIINLGNIFEEDLEDILNKKLFSEIREGFQNNKIICDLCKNCNYRKRF